MKLAELIDREQITCGSQGGKIPWDDPGFSARMLREHLSQEHDRASRRLESIDRHVSWLHETVCGGSPARVLDLGCGPGLYSARLAGLGHRCVGIDFSPASIAHARAEAECESLRCTYHLRDLRAADLGTGFGLALLTFGEFNTFPPSDARLLLDRARRALLPGAALVLEVHSEELVRSVGEGIPSWYTAAQSVFSDEPHLCLRECFWIPQDRVAVERYFVVSLDSGDVATYVSTTQAYSDQQYTAVLRETGFADITRYASLSGDRPEAEPGLFVLVARTEQVT
jgi:SAM-dependent methyltransferase